jgi:HEAT repeat protein
MWVELPLVWSGRFVAVAGLAITLAALFGDCSRGRWRCPRCWYDLRGTDSLTCSECGKTQQSQRAFYRTRRHWRWFLAGLLIVSIGYTVRSTPRIKANSAAGMIPTTVLAALAPEIYKYEPIWYEIYRRFVTDDEVWAWQRWLMARRFAMYLGCERDGAGVMPSEAADMLAVTGHPAPFAVPALIEMTECDDWRTRHAAVNALSHHQSSNRETAGVLLDLLDDRNRNVRFSAASGIGELARRGEKLPEATEEALAEAMRSDPSVRVRSISASSLVSLADVDPAVLREAIDVLVAGWKAPQAADRPMALIGLLHLENPPPDVVNAVLLALNDRDPRVRRHFVFLLTENDAWAEYTPPAAVAPALVEALAYDSRWAGSDRAREWAAGSLKRIGPAALSVQSELEALLAHRDPDVRQAARGVLDALIESQPPASTSNEPGPAAPAGTPAPGVPHLLPLSRGERGADE